MSYSPKQAHCPVCPITLGYMFKAKPIHLWCHSCDWTYQFEKNKKPKAIHKGRLDWKDERLNGLWDD